MSVALKGIDVATRLDGAYAPERIDISGQLTAVHALIAELRAEKAEGLQKLSISDDPDI
jgi:hypothetical protein